MTPFAVRFSREMHPAKQELGRWVTVSGRVTVLRDTQSMKVWTPRVVSPLPPVKEVRRIHPWKASSPMDCTESGKVTSVTFKGVHYEIIVDIDGFKWMIQSTDYVEPDADIGVYIEPDAIHIMKKSKYSGMFGDYSSFSDELDQLSDVDTAEEF